MKKPKDYPKQEILADLKFMIIQSYIIEHEQDYEKICAIRKKYGIELWKSLIYTIIYLALIYST